MTAKRAGAEPAKRYDAEYFERWYRRSNIGVGQREFVARKVRLALAAAEYVLGRHARNVLDVGCGEGPWRAILRRLRPGISYLGVDSSTYAVARYGRTRRLRLGGLSDLAHMRLARRYDLVVCSDVLHYVSDADARSPVPAVEVLGIVLLGRRGSRCARRHSRTRSTRAPRALSLASKRS